ncbi:polysaccharide pyruvyl transferase [Pseudonocardia dioxanivorans CB1190]|uniref:Polysaccharide pyruvyl transferase n=1 Tax=Pseudonocardia dioxanivorans (strain ATCC 55486 / DSM 44775 / JCM 13855 / CB1190) TaxID=675635 RepID=F4CR32_PSEUX|nr:polysaccharide pyruvyl transferase family protein [Pseudonocardia dioxanivorans]AEA24090.1 polysaccharide pyruvyl transferase [Pseudonocardia dioxanivorans CB1190]
MTSWALRPARSRRDRVPRIGLFGLLGSGNLGNDASLATVLAHLRAAYPGAEIRIMTTGHEEVAARYGVATTPLHVVDTLRRKPHGALGALVRLGGKLADGVATLVWLVGLDVVVVPGMGVLEASLPIWAWQFPLALLTLCVLARVVGTPVGLVGVGAQVVDERPLRRVLVWSARAAAYRSYRDELSRSAMRDMGVDTSRDDVYCDLVFAMPAPTPAGPVVPGAVGVGVMDYHGRNGAADRRREPAIHAAYLAMTSAFVLRLVDAGRTVRLFVGDGVDTSVADTVIREVRSARPAVEVGRVALVATDDLDGLMNAMAEVEIVVATRYHNVVAALMAGRPTVSLGYAPKNAVLMEEFGQGRFALALESTDLDTLCARFDELDADRAAAARVIAAAAQHCRRRAEAELTDMSRMLIDAAAGRAGREAPS